MDFLQYVPQVPYFSQEYGHDKVGHFIAGGGIGDFVTNRGSGGDFTQIGANVNIGSTSPSD